MITWQQLKVLCPHTANDRLKTKAAAINFAGIDFKGFYDVRVLEEFLPQVIHESGGFRIRTESGNYSAKRILQVFPKYFKTLAEAKKFENNGPALFNRVYANRMGNGPESSGDGFRYRGGGDIQITGADMYRKYANYIGKGVAETAELVRTDDYFATHSAIWLFCIKKKLIADARADNFDRITYRINGGYNGKEDRDRLYKLTKQILRN